MKKRSRRQLVQRRKEKMTRQHSATAGKRNGGREEREPMVRKLQRGETGARKEVQDEEDGRSATRIG